MTDDDFQTSAAKSANTRLACPQDFISDAPFEFELGGSVPSLTLRYETHGTLNADRSNAILVCHALSGDHHVAGQHTPADRKPGWWDAFVGPGCPLDTERFFIIGVNCVGGCQGSTGPLSPNPATGLPYGADFPQLTMRDMVRAQRLLVRGLGIERLHAVIGGSMGGMQGLVWAVDFPQDTGRVVALACAANQNARAIAFNEIGRVAIMSDPAWRGGHYALGAGPKAGLALARMLGHVTYLSEAGMGRRFGRRAQEGACPANVVVERGPFHAEFAVESYLNYQGLTFTERFDANSYLAITKAADRFDLAAGRSLEAVFAPVRARVCLIGFSSDLLYPPADNHDVLAALLRAGKNATYTELETDAGHDAFLLPTAELFQAIRNGIE
ncbi:MAG: homoserine O-acetyltransferase [Puniceicoccales bacterium]|nr:homoserine O-acetyltransferase [Puniceicoccales bacterium]